MKNVIITGATGMVGSLVLETCLARTDVATVTSITRRPCGIIHPKLVEVIHDDFLDYLAIEDVFQNQDICFFCLGVYTGQVSPVMFRQITVDYVRAFAEVLKAQSPDAHFGLLSGQGADRTEKSRIMFARDKGAAENILTETGFSRLALFRPGYIYPETPRIEPNFSYRLMRRLYYPVSRIFSNVGLSSGQLARAMVRALFEGVENETLENRDLRLLSKPAAWR